MGADVSLSHSNIDMISQFVTYVTPASPSVRSLDSILGLAPKFVRWFSTAVLQNKYACMTIRPNSYSSLAGSSSFQHLLLSYTVDLISVLRNLFSTGITATWDGLQEAYQVYERSGSRQNLHRRIFSNTKQGGHLLNKDEMGGMVREMLAPMM